MINFFSEITYVSTIDLIPHEQIKKSRVSELIKRIKKEKVFTTPIIVDKKSMVIIDGHHRYHAAHMLKLKKIPCVLIDYSSPNILALQKSSIGKQLKKSQIIKSAIQGKLFDHKYTFHVYKDPKNQYLFHLSNLSKRSTVEISDLT